MFISFWKIIQYENLSVYKFKIKGNMNYEMKYEEDDDENGVSEIYRGDWTMRSRLSKYARENEADGRRKDETG